MLHAHKRNNQHGSRGGADDDGDSSRSNGNGGARGIARDGGRESLSLDTLSIRFIMTASVVRYNKQKYLI